MMTTPLTACRLCTRAKPGGENVRHYQTSQRTIIRTARTHVLMPFRNQHQFTNATVSSSTIFKSDVGGRCLFLACRQNRSRALARIGLVSVLSLHAMSLSYAVVTGIQTDGTTSDLDRHRGLCLLRILIRKPMCSF